jgi:hypothetical protein
VALAPFLKDLQDLQPWQRRFEAGAFELVDVVHGFARLAGAAVASISVGVAAVAVGAEKALPLQ